MESKKKPQEIGEDLNKLEVGQQSPLADIISLETVVNVLVNKGLCTPEELFEEEQARRHYNRQVKDISLVQTEPGSITHKSKKSRRHKQNWLKRKMSKRRWTRNLGTRLFGWRWKKVKTNHHTQLFENVES